MDPAILFISANQLGIKRVVLDADRKVRMLFNDQTRHGMQSTEPDREDEPLAYYHRSGPLGDVFSACLSDRPAARLAVIGLGVGCMAAYVEAGQNVTFHEIDQAVVRIASDQQFFTFIARCRGKCDLLVGDGRESLSRTPDGTCDLIVVDAFANDYIPPHLVDAEAIEFYLQKLLPTGVMAFHITNVHVDLGPSLVKIAAEAGLTALVCSDLEVSEDERSKGRLPSRYAVLARDSGAIAKLVDNPRWSAV